MRKLAIQLVKEEHINQQQFYGKNIAGEQREVSRLGNVALRDYFKKL
jgi:hypothetical protein